MNIRVQTTNDTKSFQNYELCCHSFPFFCYLLSRGNSLKSQLVTTFVNGYKMYCFLFHNCSFFLINYEITLSLGINNCDFFFS